MKAHLNLTKTICLLVACFLLSTNAIYTGSFRGKTPSSDPEGLSIVSAVKAGYPVTFSSMWNPSHVHYRLDDVGGETGSKVGAWCAAVLDTNQWIQVSSLEPKYWIGVTTQGREDCSQWVTKYTVHYTLDGEDWCIADRGRVFNGNTDQTTKVDYEFSEPIYARTIRIVPQAWNGHISMRFEAYFKEERERC